MAEDGGDLRALYARLMERPGGSHLTEDDWERLALRQMEEGERQRAFEHVTRCGRCARAYRALRLLEEEAPAMDAGVVRPLRPARPASRVLHAWALGGGLAAAAALVLWVAVRPVHAPSTLEPAGEAFRSGPARPAALFPKGRFSAPPGEFRWEGGAQGGRHRVQLLDAAGEPIWTSEPVEGTSLPWPPAVTLSPGRYHWQVVASPSGERQAELVSSPLVSFEYVPPAVAP